MKPSSKSEHISELRSKVVTSAYSSGTSCYVESAEGALVRDVDGREFIDFAGGIGVMNVGHSHPKVVAAIKDQAEKFTHTCFMVLPYEAAVLLAEKLCAVTPGSFPKAAAQRRLKMRLKLPGIIPSGLQSLPLKTHFMVAPY